MFGLKVEEAVMKYIVATHEMWNASDYLMESPVLGQFLQAAILPLTLQLLSHT